MEINYKQLDHLDFTLIRPLWEQLRDHHANHSKYFSRQIHNTTFDERSRDLTIVAEQGLMTSVLAYESNSSKLVGYCIGSIINGNKGEIDSIFVLEDLRGNGIGDQLMRRILDWFQKQCVNNIGISVLFGNEKALPFYERYGFYPRSYILTNKRG